MIWFWIATVLPVGLLGIAAFVGVVFERDLLVLPVDLRRRRARLDLEQLQSCRALHAARWRAGDQPAVQEGRAQTQTLRRKDRGGPLARPLAVHNLSNEHPPVGAPARPRCGGRVGVRRKGAGAARATSAKQLASKQRAP